MDFGDYKQILELLDIDNFEKFITATVDADRALVEADKALSRLCADLDIYEDMDELEIHKKLSFDDLENYLGLKDEIDEMKMNVGYARTKLKIIDEMNDLLRSGASGYAIRQDYKKAMNELHTALGENRASIVTSKVATKMLLKAKKDGTGKIDKEYSKKLIKEELAKLEK